MFESVKKLQSDEFFRTEKDLLGTREDIPAEALYGIHTLRAIENFPTSGKMVNPALVNAFGFVKWACARTNNELGLWEGEGKKGESIEKSCEEMSRGELTEHVVVDALQGGAGTSTNMNVNEVLANRALQIMGLPYGKYQAVSPTDDLNLHQSTNDSYPTALKLAAIVQIRELVKSLDALVDAFKIKEKEFAHVLKIGRTQMQDAVPVTLGREMAAYAAVFRRDKERLSKCEEKLCAVNLGGTAIGTGLAAPHEYILRVAEVLKELTDIEFVRAEDMVENTQNEDVFVEISGMLKTCASSLIKCANDLRLMSSGPEAGFGEIELPPRQAGSSIMPGKVNPVIPETVIQASLRVYGHDMQISAAASAGNLELNAFMPLIADSILDSIDLLKNASDILQTRCVEGIKAKEEKCRSNVTGSTAFATALVSVMGYETACEIAKKAGSEKRNVRDVVIENNYMTAEQFDEVATPEALLKLGS